MIWAAFLLAWGAAGIFAHAFLNAYIWTEFPDRDAASRAKDFRFSLIVGLAGGPLALLAALDYTKHGVRFLP